jgi:hypothetical protein
MSGFQHLRKKALARNCSTLKRAIKFALIKQTFSIGSSRKNNFNALVVARSDF